ncbi:MAG: 4Fe-4S single cluster domain-containing protein, partial [Dethiosulfovibrio sp.]|nr:4Fe-4S single cluster domain-containing protein [Dethiosulfovibrio sp.]
MKEDTMLLRLLHCPVETLGPGRRIGIWFQGCSIGCEGCIAPENQPFDQSFKTSIESVQERVRYFLEVDRGINGVTISGGEPFDQPEALASLISLLRDLGLDDILVYSGYEKKFILRDHSRIARLLTALVDGPFRRGELTEAVWKGSGNQTLTVFDSNYAEMYIRWSTETKGQLQIVRHEHDIYLVGI